VYDICAWGFTEKHQQSLGNDVKSTSSIVSKLNASSKISLLMIASFKNDELEGTRISSPWAVRLDRRCWLLLYLCDCRDLVGEEEELVWAEELQACLSSRDLLLLVPGFERG